jgi:hypothetical protein
MVTSQRINKGVKSGRITRPEPQSDWDSFSLTTGIPKDKRGIFPLPAGTTTSHCVEPGVEGTAQEGRKKKPCLPNKDTSEKGQAKEE